jgi:hypothetical protein
MIIDYHPFVPGRARPFNARLGELLARIRSENGF